MKVKKIKVRNPPNPFLIVFGFGKTLILYIYMFELEFKQPFFFY